MPIVPIVPTGTGDCHDWRGRHRLKLDISLLREMEKSYFFFSPCDNCDNRDNRSPLFWGNNLPAPTHPVGWVYFLPNYFTAGIQRVMNPSPVFLYGYFLWCDSRRPI